MSIENLLKTYENKITALEAKCKVATEKGNSDLLNVFNQELIDAKVDLAILKKGLGDTLSDTEDIKKRFDLILNEFRNYLGEEILRIKNSLNNMISEISLKLEDFRSQIDINIKRETCAWDVKISKELTALHSKYQKEIDRLDKAMEMYNKGNRFVRMWKVLCGKL